MMPLTQQQQDFEKAMDDWYEMEKDESGSYHSIQTLYVWHAWRQCMAFYGVKDAKKD